MVHSGSFASLTTNLVFASGLINQSVIAGSIAVICITSQEIMKRRRRGKYRQSHPEGLGSVESWEFA